MTFTNLEKTPSKKNLKSMSLTLIDMPQDNSVHSDFTMYRVFY
jgi:hypothetical protein